MPKKSKTGESNHKVMKEMFDIAVVGGGPAGMTAALYAVRASKSVLLLEENILGGQILASQRIENYPALPNTDGYTFSENLKSQLLAGGVETKFAAVKAIRKECRGFCIVTDTHDVFCRAVILATGLKHRQLGVLGEDEWIGRGISFCASCDGMLYRKKEVAVVGGGNTAVQDALTLSDYCAKVHLIHRREELRAERGLVERLWKRENIIYHMNTVVEKICGERMLENLCLKNITSGEQCQLAVSGLFEAVGQIPQNEIFRSLTKLDDDGYFVTDSACRTSCDGVFAAGDAVQKQIRQLTTAVADGTVAALSAVAYLAEHSEDGKENEI